MLPVQTVTFGEKVKKLREMRGWSQQELAQRGGFSVTFISKLETNAKNYLNPTYSTLNALASALGVKTFMLTEWGGLNPLSETLRILRQKKRLSLKKLSKASGISEADLTAFEEGTKFPDSNQMLRIGIAFNKTFDELILNRPKDEQLGPRLIPELVISPAQGGMQFDEEGHIRPNDGDRTFLGCPPDVRDPFAYAVRITRDDAVEPFLMKGTRLICATNEGLKEKDLVILLTKTNGMTGGELDYDGDKTIIKPFNPKEPLETYAAKDVKAIHKVVWIRRR